MSKLSDHYKMINEIGGIKTPELPSNITLKDLNFDGAKGEQGSATIYYLDGIAFELNWYSWNLDFWWMVSQIEKELGRQINIIEITGGNGHEQGLIQYVEGGIKKIVPRNEETDNIIQELASEYNKYTKYIREKVKTLTDERLLDIIVECDKVEDSDFFGGVATKAKFELRLRKHKEQK